MNSSLQTSYLHPVAPEAVMAFLDGELSVAEAQSISEHIASCDECAAVAQSLRSTSQSLTLWNIPTPPEQLEESIRDRAAKAAPSGSLRLWKPWMIWSGGAIAIMLVCLVALFVPRYRKSSPSNVSLFSRALSDQPQSEPSAGVVMYEQMGRSTKTDRYLALDQLGKGPGEDKSQQFDRLDRAAKLMAPPALKAREAVVAPDEVSSNTAPMIARTAALTIQVKNIDASRSSLDAILARHHGYTAKIDVNTAEFYPHSITSSLRIPSRELITTLTDLKSLGRTLNETQSGEEVSQQHADLEARLKTARATEERFRAILQQRTGSVADVLQVEEGIARVRGDIERMEAEQKDLDHRVDFASVEVTLNQEYKATLTSPGDSTGTQMSNALVAGFHHATGTLLGIVLFAEEYGPAILIWLLILGVPVFLLRLRYRSMRDRL